MGIIKWVEREIPDTVPLLGVVPEPVVESDGE